MLFLQVLALGIYRAPRSVNEASLSYVYTCPSSDSIMYINDKIFVYGNPETIKKLEQVLKIPLVRQSGGKLSLGVMSFLSPAKGRKNNISYPPVAKNKKAETDKNFSFNTIMRTISKLSLDALVGQDAKITNTSSIKAIPTVEEGGDSKSQTSNHLDEVMEFTMPDADSKEFKINKQPISQPAPLKNVRRVYVASDSLQYGSSDKKLL
jgi:hypothetical protein